MNYKCSQCKFHCICNNKDAYLQVGIVCASFVYKVPVVTKVHAVERKGIEVSR